MLNIAAASNFLSGFDYDGSISSLPGTFQLPYHAPTDAKDYCLQMFYNSALTKGNGLVTLRFSSPATNVFSGTDITPTDPASGTTVYVNGSGKTPPIYTVTFNPQGGSVSPVSKKFLKDTSIGNLPIPIKVGYTFESWNSKADGTGTPYYTSTYINGNTTAYAIWRKQSSEKDILSFTIAGVNATINGTDITATVSHGTAISSLTPSISISAKAMVTPQGAQNFTNPVSYTVIAEDGTTKIYTVTVKVAAAPVTTPAPTDPTPTPTDPTPTNPQTPAVNTKVKVTKVSLATTPPVYLVKGRALALKASVQPYNATNKKLTYKSLSPKIVKVDKNTGKMKALKTGKARIVVTSQDGKKKAACTIIVVAKTLKVKALKSFSPLTLTVGKTKQIKAKVTPAKATGVMPAYSSSNKKVATIDKAGVITAHKKGTTTITVRAGGKTKTFKVTVR